MAKLEVQVGINNAPFKRGLDEMRSGAARLSGSLKGMFAGAIGIAGITAAIKRTIEYADKVDDLSKRHKVGTTELQKLGLAAERNGSSFDAAANGLDKLAIASSKATRGDEEMIRSFEDLGVTVQDLATKSPEEILRLIGASAMEAEPLVKVLGRTSLELRDALAALASGADDFGAVMEGKVVEGLANVQDKIERVSQELLVGLGPAIIFVMETMDLVVAGWTTAFKMMLATAVGTRDALKKVWQGDFLGVDGVLDKLWADIQKAANELTKLKVEPPQNEAATKRDFDDSEAEDKASQKREDRLKKIRDAEADAARAALEGQEKINALIEERNRLLEVYKAAADDDDAGIDALEKAQQIQRQIEQEEKRQGEEKKRREDEIATKKAEEAQAEVDRAERLARAITDERQAHEDNIISTLEGADKVKALETKRDRMTGEAQELEGYDPEAASRKRTEIIGVNAEIRGERESMAEKAKDALKKAEDEAKAAADAKSRAAASVSVDSLQAVGGGRGNIGGTADPILRANEQQVNLLREIRQLLGAGNEKAIRKDADPWR